MLRALWFMIKLGAVAALAAWLAAQPGEVNLTWRDYTVRVDGGLFLVLLLGAILLAIFVYSVLRGIANIPRSWRRYRAERARLQGYRALTLGLSALAAGDEKTAAQQSRKAAALLPGDKGLPVLLQAQVARLQGRTEDAQQNFTALLGNRDTAFLGARGLLLQAIEQKDDAAARDILKKALALQPKQSWLLTIAYELELRTQQWEAARGFLKRLEQIGAVSSIAAREDRAVMLIAEADDYVQKGWRERAKQRLKKALQVRPHFVPAVKRLAGLQMYDGKRRKAEKMIEAAWRVQDHPDLAQLWMAVMPPHKTSDNAARYHWAEKLLQIAPKNAAGYVAVARTAMEQKLWGEARVSLQKALEIAPTSDLYLMLAELEEHSGYMGAAYTRLQEQAASAPPPPTWVCQRTGRIYAEWAALAMPHGAFNSMVWQMPATLKSMDDQGALITGRIENLLDAPIRARR